MARTLRLDRMTLPTLVIMVAVAVVLLVLVIFWARGCGQDSEVESEQAPGDAGAGVPQTGTPGIVTPQPSPEPFPEPKPEPTPEPPRARSLYEQYYQAGRQAFDRGEYIAARNQLSQALKGIGEPFLLQAKTQLATIAKKLTFSRDIVAGDTTAESYHVKSGELPSTVVKKYGITSELFLKINNIASDRLMMAGRNYKVVKGPFDVVIHKKTFEMEVYLGDYFIKKYRIGLGIDNSTPEGQFLAGEKLEEPEWIGAVGDAGRRVRVPYGDKRNPLGERWISLRALPEQGGKDTDYGIHGTNDPGTIGSQASRGCIRMHNDDVLDLFDLLVMGKSRIMVIAD